MIGVGSRPQQQEEEKTRAEPKKDMGWFEDSEDDKLIVDPDTDSELSGLEDEVPASYTRNR